MAYRDSTTNTGNTSGGNPSVSVPSGVAADDIVILSVTIDRPSDTFTYPAGFTEFTGSPSNPTADGQSIGFAWKRLTGADAGSYTITPSGSTDRDWVCQAIAFSGRHTTNPPVGGTVKTQSSAQASVATIDANGVTAEDDDDLCWVVCGDPTSDGLSWSIGPPSGYTEAEDSARIWAWASMAYKLAVSAGATGTVSGTATLGGNSTGYASILVRVPVAGGGAAGQPITKRLGGVQFTASRAPAQQGMRQF